MAIVYDNQFNKNEWFVIVILILGFLLVYKLPKRFSSKETLAYVVYFAFLGLVVDHTVSLDPFDFYDVNDLSTYQLMDFLTYLSFGPYGYLFIYLYDLLKIKDSYNAVYILPWALGAVLVEYMAQAWGVYHYKNGYTIYYSFPIYLILISCNLYFYKFITRHKTN